MGSFTTTLDVNTPTLSSLSRFGQEELRDIKAGMMERLALEHYFTMGNSGAANQDPDVSDGDGRHKPGKVSVVLLDTETNILATTPKGSGCLAYGTDTSIMYIWNGTNWSTYKLGSSRVNVSVSDFLAGTVPSPNMDYFTYSGAGNFSRDGFTFRFATWGSVPAANYIEAEQDCYLTVKISGMSYNYNGYYSVRLASNSAGAGAETIAGSDGKLGYAETLVSGSLILTTFIPKGFFYQFQGRSGVASGTITVRTLKLI
jgi:hypothetical protein